MGLLRFLFIAIAILYAVRLIARLLLPMFFKSIVNKAQQQANSQYQQQQPHKPEGSIRVDYVPHEKRSSVPDSEGEYVSYEEVK